MSHLESLKCRRKADDVLLGKVLRRLLVALLFVGVCGPLHADDEVVEIENQVNALKLQGEYQEAEKLCLKMIEVAKRTGKPIWLAVAYTDISTLYLEIDRWRDAEPYCREALKIFETKFGPDHFFTADALTNLAELYRREARLREAEQLFRRALTIREKHYGPQHEDVSAAVANLAMILDDEGRFAEAEPLHQRALNLRACLQSRFVRAIRRDMSPIMVM